MIQSLLWKPLASSHLKFVNGQVAPYKKLREIRFIEKMPLLATGKVNRRELNITLDES